MATRPLDPSLFKHRRDSPAGVEYVGTKPYTLPNGSKVQPGERLSRRQYENLRYQAGGWASKSEYERVTHGHMRGVPHEANAYRNFARMYSEEHDDESMRKVVGPDSEFSRAFVSAYRDGFKDRLPGSPFAKLLVIVGVRDAEATYNVGETP